MDDKTTEEQATLDESLKSRCAPLLTRPSPSGLQPDDGVLGGSDAGRAPQPQPLRRSLRVRATAAAAGTIRDDPLVGRAARRLKALNATVSLFKMQFDPNTRNR